MTNYVVGFLFDDDMVKFALITKSRPEWQAGLLNGIGGKIEDGEQPIDAMKREFAEETGVSVTDWKHFCVLRPAHKENIHFFYVRDTHKLARVRTMTDEIVSIVDDTFFRRAVPNLSWLVPMARSMARGERASGFDVWEVGSRG